MDQSLLPSIYDFISHTYPFTELSALETDAVAAAIKIFYKSPDDILDNEDLAGAGLYMVRTGAAEEINKKDKSLRAKLAVGDTFGYTQIDKHGQSDYFVRFPENTLLYFISKQVLQFLISKNHAVEKYFNKEEWVRLSGTHNDGKNSSNFLEGRTAGSVCRHAPPMLTPDCNAQDAACELSKHHSYLAVIVDKDKISGVITASDIAQRLVAKALPYSTKVSEIMTEDVITVDASEPLDLVLELMIQHNVRCIPVTDAGIIKGLITTTELLQNSALEAVYLIRDIKNAQTLDELSELSKRTEGIFSSMLEADMQPHAVQRTMSKIADTFCDRILRMTVAKLGPAPCAFAFVAAGSLARCEIQLLSDQDNAIITERPLNAAEANYFSTLAQEVCTALDRCGYPLCQGNYMASNPKWRVSYQDWSEYYSKWISDTASTSLLNSLVFLDIRLLFGDEFLVNKLKQHLLNTVQRNTRFLALLCEVSTAVAPPLGTFRQFVLTKDGNNTKSLNIKSQAVNLIIELARLYALGANSTATDTVTRLNDATKAGLLRQEDCRELSEAYEFLNTVRLRHQLDSIKKHQPLSNSIDPSELTQFERNHLRDAFRIISRHQAAALVRFAPSRGIFG